MRRASGQCSARLLVVVVCCPCFWVYAEVSPRTREFEFTYQVEVRDIPESAARLDLWLPYPRSDENQEVREVEIQAPLRGVITQENEHGNTMLYFGVEKPADRLFPATLKLRIRRKETTRQLVAGVGGEDGGEDHAKLERFLRPERLIPVDDRVRRWVKDVVSGKETAAEKVGAIYQHAVSTMKYDKTGTGWGNGDLLYACDVRKGNCTDFHALFIGYSRAAGIPARFDMGFPLPAVRGQGFVGGYHCWAEFYLDGPGWIPVDCSEAWKDPSRKDYFFGAIDENRVQFSRGRDLLLNPPQRGERLNYFIYPYAEIDGKEFKNVEKKFSFKDFPPES